VQSDLFKITNVTRAQTLASTAKKCDSFLGRFVGLMFSKSLPTGEGIVIDPCKQIHMFWMFYAIDAIFIDKSGTVVGIAKSIKPWRISKMFSKAQSVIEVPSGTTDNTGTDVGDQIKFE
jgi:uncharacterized protein